MTEKARVLGHDGQVLAELVVATRLPTIKFAAPPLLRELLGAHLLDAVPYHELTAEYEQTADDGTRIYRLRVAL